MSEHAASSTTDDGRTRRRSGPLEEIVLPRPRCPRCSGMHLKKYRSIFDQGDGTALWWVKCRNASCSHRFRVLLE